MMQGPDHIKKIRGSAGWGFALCVATGTLCALPAVAQDDIRINYQDHIEPIFRQYCVGCHNQRRASNGLKLDSYTGILEGGSSGAAVKKGDSVGSLLYELVAHQREPFMPDLEPRLPDEIIQRVRAWIAGGAPQTKDDQSFVPPTAAPALTLDPASLASPEGATAVPEGLTTEPYWWTERPNTITALAASPFAPVVAVGGFRQVILYRTDSLELLAVLDFPEGTIHTLQFSRDGSLLLAGGGHAATSGVAVAWDVATGDRVLEVGAEPDVVLAADISNDHSMVALGGPAGVVQVFDTATGSVLHEIEKHTDWITAIEFSPDGVLLATGDRAGGAFVWESLTGREFHTLPTHAGPVTAMSWRPDSQMLATSGDDGRIRLLDAENGREQRTWQAHGGVLDLCFDRQGRIATCGRDRLGRLFDGAGAQQSSLGPLADLATAVVVSHDGSRAIVGGWTGEVLVFNLADGKRLGSLAANPPTTVRLAVAQAEAAIPPIEQELRTTDTALTEAGKGLDGLEQVAETARQAATDVEARLNALLPEVARATAGHKAGQEVIANLDRLLEGRAATETSLASQTDEAAGVAADTAKHLDEAVAALLVAEQAVNDAGTAHNAARQAADQNPQDEQLTAAAQATEAALSEAGNKSHTAQQLHAGAMAIAEQAAADQARLEVRLVRLRTENSLRAEAEATNRTEALARQEAARAVFAIHEALQTEADAARTASSIAQTALDERQQQLVSVQARHNALTDQLANAQASLSQARAAWNEQRAAIEAARGRVLQDG